MKFETRNSMKKLCMTKNCHSKTWLEKNELKFELKKMSQSLVEQKTENQLVRAHFLGRHFWKF